MLRRFGKWLWRFMVIFSFIVNIVLVVVLLVLGIFIFEIKNEIAQPLVTGLHSSFVGLDEATIDRTIPVRTSIPVVLDIPLETDTVVTLVEPVPLQVDALIDLPGINAYNVNASVDLELPVGLQLPVALDLDVHVDQPLDVELDVRAVIPLADTQLHDVAENLRLLFEPLAVGLTNLPDDFGEATDMVGDVLGGDMPDLLAENEYSISPWPGFSRTAGLGYELYVEPVPISHLPVQTGIVPLGGIPTLDEMLRSEVYDAGGPIAVNENARSLMSAQNVDPMFYNGDIGALLVPSPAIPTPPPEQAPVVPDNTGGPIVPPPSQEDQGIIPTPTGP